jgi:hypothetical protein
VQSALYKTSESQEIDDLFTTIQNVWRIAEQREWMAKSERGFSEELRSVKRISKVLFSRPASVL